jgi:CheY-like chemotaxis protein
LNPAPLIVQQAPKVVEIDDDRESVLPGAPVILIVEDDPHFAGVLLLLVRERSFKGVVTSQGAHVRSLTRQFKPLAIMLDIFLPDMLGWTALNQLKQDPETRHIPVQIISVQEERMQGLGHGLRSRPPPPVPQHGNFCSSTTSTASCSICTCPISPDSICWSAFARMRNSADCPSSYLPGKI